jgi:non-specific serine/threonine protein kinase/serine/threonine-protein kinase
MNRCPSCGATEPRSGWPHPVCPGCLLKTGADNLDEPIVSPRPEAVPERIGPFDILEKVGEGGMGVVYRGRQTRPVQRTVAIKLMRSGLGSSDVVARFEAERQALTLMDHPGIARLYDAGTTDDGRPYFAMDYVQGDPITTYCDQHRLETSRRVALFLDVCDAVQHAHHRGVVHRDLKPANVLVAQVDGRPLVRVIDFGVAKALHGKLTEETLVTQHGILIGTPEYMSPEQVSGGGQDVDTRTDVYSLGVLLYELLVGARPIDVPESGRAAMGEVLRQIREEDPPRPSHRLGSLGYSATEHASLRTTDPGLHRRQLQGDLDWIVMKALAKDRDRRYSSPAELAADLERHLGDEPVTAGPPSATYRARKFVRRHRLGVSVAATALVALLVAVVGTTYGLLRALRAEREAVENAETAEQVSDFLVDLFEVSDPRVARGDEVSARQLLDNGAERLQRGLTDQPLLLRRLEGTLGRVYASLGEFDDAEPLLRSSLGPGPIEPEADAKAALWLGWVHVARGELDKGEEILLQALEAAREDPLIQVRVLLRIGNLERRRGRLEAAVGAIERAFDILDDPEIDSPSDFIDASRVLATTYSSFFELAKAQQALDTALQVARDQLVEEDPQYLRLRFANDVLLFMTGRLEEADASCLETLELDRRVLGHDHIWTLDSQFLCAGIAEDLLRLREAAVAIDEYNDKMGRFTAPDNPQRLGGLLMETDTLIRLGDLSEAEERLLEARRLAADRFGESSGMVAASYCYEGAIALLSGERDEYARLIATCFESLTASGSEAEIVQYSFLDLACAEARAGEDAAAIAHLREAVDRGFRRFDPATRPEFSHLVGDPEFMEIAARAAPSAY